MSTPTATTTRIASTKGAGKVSVAPEAGKEGTPDKKKKKKSKKKLIIIVLVVLLVGGGAYFMMGKKPAKGGPSGQGTRGRDGRHDPQSRRRPLPQAQAGPADDHGQGHGEHRGSDLDTSEAADIAVSEFTNKPIAELSTDAGAGHDQGRSAQEAAEGIPGQTHGRLLRRVRHAVARVGGAPGCGCSPHRAKDRRSRADRCSRGDQSNAREAAPRCLAARRWRARRARIRRNRAL